MLRFFARSCLGIEITSKAIRVGVLSVRGRSTNVRTVRTEPLSPGMVQEGFGVLTIRDVDALAAVLRTCLREDSRLKARKIALSLPDSIFRIQTLDLDDFPSAVRDREKLIRWKLDKAAFFDTENTVLRYQAVPRAGGGFSVTACAAKREVIDQYEDLLEALGREVWHIGPSSLNALNFYASELQTSGAAGYAFCWITDAWYALVVMEGGGPRFYRLREIKTGATGDGSGRIIREIEDALHFYTHRDRHATSEIGRVALAGNITSLSSLAAELRNVVSLDVDVLASASAQAEGMAPAFGAGGVL